MQGYDKKLVYMLIKFNYQVNNKKKKKHLIGEYFNYR